MGFGLVVVLERVRPHLEDADQVVAVGAVPLGTGHPFVAELFWATAAFTRALNARASIFSPS